MARRFWIDRFSQTKETFIIKGPLYHHICRVCKIKKGEIFELFCEGQQKYQVTLSSISGSKAIAQIVKSFTVPALKKPYLYLAVSLPKLSKMDFLIEKSVELGVKKIYPFISHFSFLKSGFNSRA